MNGRASASQCRLDQRVVGALMDFAVLKFPQYIFQIIPKQTMGIEKLFRRTVATLVVGWLAFSFFQTGSRPDENEHCHAAWLIAVKGLRPFQDFFQHHSPALWDFLSLFYRFGGTGPGVVLWGRALVVLCLCVILFSLWSVSHGGRSREQGNLSFSISLLLLVASATMMFEDFVIRPETLAVAFFSLSFLWWQRLQATSRKPTTKFLLGIIGAGAFYGCALFASVRLILVAPLFLSPLLGNFSKYKSKSLAGLGLGTIAGFLLYALLGAHSLEEYGYLIWFSAKLQKIGTPPPLRPYYWDRSPFATAPFLISAGLFVWYLKHSTVTARPKIAFLFCGYLASLALAILSCYPHVYCQNLMPALVFLTFGLVEAGRHFEWPLTESHAVLAVLMVWLMTTMTSEMRRIRFQERDIISNYQQKLELLSHLGPHDTVLLPYDKHPVAVLDASFYGGYLESLSDRQFQFVKWAQQYRTLPNFDLMADLRENKPAYINPRTLTFAIPASEREEMENIRRQNYRSPFLSDLRWEFSHLAQRINPNPKVKLARNPQAGSQER